MRTADHPSQELARFAAGLSSVRIDRCEIEGKMKRLVNNGGGATADATQALAQRFWQLAEAPRVGKLRD
jgi:hypothetical protein